MRTHLLTYWGVVLCALALAAMPGIASAQDDCAALMARVYDDCGLTANDLSGAVIADRIDAVNACEDGDQRVRCAAACAANEETCDDVAACLGDCRDQEFDGNTDATIGITDVVIEGGNAVISLSADGPDIVFNLVRINRGTLFNVVGSSTVKAYASSVGEDGAYSFDITDNCPPDGSVEYRVSALLAGEAGTNWMTMDSRGITVSKSETCYDETQQDQNCGGCAVAGASGRTPGAPAALLIIVVLARRVLRGAGRKRKPAGTNPRTLRNR